MKDSTKDSNPADSPIACAASGPADGQEPQGPPPEASPAKAAGTGDGSLVDNLRRATAMINTPPYEMHEGNPWLGHLAAMMDMAAIEIDRRETARGALQSEVDRLEGENAALKGRLEPEAADAPCVYCDATGWVEDENWGPEFDGHRRRQGDGYILCSCSC